MATTPPKTKPVTRYCKRVGRSGHSSKQSKGHLMLNHFTENFWLVLESVR
jgi:hypothetical protein